MADLTDSRTGELPLVPYAEATHPGSSFPNRAGFPADHGSVLPVPSFAGISPSIAGVSRLFGAGSFTAPPNASRTGAASRYSADISKSLPVIGPSVLSTLYSATPLSNVTEVLQDLPGVERRPLIPVGLRERASAAFPEGVRQRATVWARAVARFRSSRPTSGGRVSRE